MGFKWGFDRDLTYLIGGYEEKFIPLTASSIRFSCSSRISSAASIFDADESSASIRCNEVTYSFLGESAF